MKPLSDMTPEELRAWAAAEAEAARARFAGEPLPDFSRVKRADHPHLERTGWGFSLVAGMPVRVWRHGRSTSAAPDLTTVVRLAPVADGGPLALVVQTSDGTWALRRRDGAAAWAERVTTRSTVADAPTVPVLAWQPGTAETIRTPPTDTAAWTVQGAETDGDGCPVWPDSTRSGGPERQ